MASGFYRDQLGANKAPEKIVMADVAFGTPLKAANADEYMRHEEHVRRLPESLGRLRRSRASRRSPTRTRSRRTTTGARAELVHWTSADGIPLKGILYKPENFDPNKKYPMISYFYESLSNSLHSYVAAERPQRHQPDALRLERLSRLRAGHRTTRTGYPGPSAYKSIVPGVQMLLARGLRRREASRASRVSRGAAIRRRT